MMIYNLRQPAEVDGRGCQALEKDSTETNRWKKGRKQ